VNRREGLARYFPGPLVATALLLVLLILLTPVLVPNGQPAAGTIFTQAQLTVDCPAANVTNFYLHSPESSVRYAEIEVWSATNFSWSGGFPSGPLNWTRVTDQSGLIAFQFNTTANPVALNITILYTYTGGQAYYVGEFAFYVGTSAGSTTVSLFAVTTTSGTSLSPGVTVTPISDLPGYGLIVLADAGSSP
jgi:hypothetical protein